MNSVYVHKLTTWAFLFKNWWTIDINIKHYNTQSFGLVNNTIELDLRQTKRCRFESVNNESFIRTVNLVLFQIPSVSV